MNLDPGSGTGGPVNAVSLQTDGKVLVGALGIFETMLLFGHERRPPCREGLGPHLLHYSLLPAHSNTVEESGTATNG